VKNFLAFGLGSIVLIASLFLGVTFGTETFSVQEVMAALFPPTHTDSTSFSATIIQQIRLPRTLLAALCGGLLAGSGAVFQGFFRNPLADSGIMGISSGAALGAVFSALLSANFATPLFAFGGALAAALIVFGASRLHGKYSGTTIIILTGTAASAFFSALTSLLVLLKDRELYKIFVWTLGSFNGKGWNELQFILPVTIVALILLCLCPRNLDLLGGGETSAQALGLNLATTKFLVLGAGSLAAAAAVCTGGTIGFVGLIVPHLSRRLYSPRHQLLIPASILFGASFVILADLIARTAIPPAEIPVGLVTSLAGAPFFVFLLLAAKGESYE
jgi:iron complex transport system permease protein